MKLKGEGEEVIEVKGKGKYNKLVQISEKNRCININKSDIIFFSIIIIVNILIIYYFSERKYKIKHNNDRNIEQSKIEDISNKEFKKVFKKEIRFWQNCIDNEINSYNLDNKNPKLSLIIHYNNQGIFLKRLLNSIQNQKLKEIEIIIINDASTDQNSNSLLEQYKFLDNRIIIIHNSEKKGFLYSYSQGVEISRANYIMFVNAGDMLFPNLKELYDISEKNGKDINDFNFIEGNLNNNYDKKINNNIIDKQFFQPFIHNMIFDDNLDMTLINNKIIKTNLIKKAIKSIRDEYLNSHLLYHYDTILLISFFSQAKSYISYKNYYSNFLIENDNPNETPPLKTYNELFKACIYLLQYLSELEYNSKEDYNKHIKFGRKAIWIALYKCSNNKLIVNWEKTLGVINAILDNPDLNENNKKQLLILIQKIKVKNMNAEL